MSSATLSENSHTWRKKCFQIYFAQASKNEWIFWILKRVFKAFFFLCKECYIIVRADFFMCMLWKMTVPTLKQPICAQKTFKLRRVRTKVSWAVSWYDMCAVSLDENFSASQEFFQQVAWPAEWFYYSTSTTEKNPSLLCTPVNCGQTPLCF